MKPLFRSFGIFIRQIAGDKMLWAVCLAPLLTAFVFRFGVPYAETLLCDYFQKQVILARYYLLFDLFLFLIPSYMLCFASAMVMLTERDENMAVCIAVTPVGKTGYILSRQVFPAAIAFFYTHLLAWFFTLNDWDLPMISAVSLLMCLSGTAAMYLVVSFSRNRVEGMAMAKIAALVFLGLVIPFFVTSDVQYIASVLPTYWTARFCREGNSLMMLVAFAVSLAWIAVLGRRYEKKIC